MNEKIFISYSRADMTIVRPFVEDINKRLGIECWMDLNGIESGEQFEEKIITAIDACEIVLFMLSDNSNKSENVKDEIRYANNTKKKVVPVVIDGGQLRGWFLFKFGGSDYINIQKVVEKEKLIRNLRDWLGLPDMEKALAEIGEHLKAWKKLESEQASLYDSIKKKEASIGNRNTDASREIEALLKGNDEEVKSLQSENATLKKDIQKVEAQLKTLQQEKEQQSEENKKLATENKALESQLETCNQEKIKSLDLIKNLQAQIENNKQQTYKPSFSGSQDKTITLLGQKVKFHKFENLWVGESNACGLLVNRRDLENVLDEIVTAFSKKYSGTIDIPTPDLLDSLYNSELRDKLSLNKRIWAKTQNNKKAMYWYLPSRNHYTTVTDTESARLNLVISEAET